MIFEYFNNQLYFKSYGRFLIQVYLHFFKDAKSIQYQVLPTNFSSRIICQNLLFEQSPHLEDFVKLILNKCITQQYLFFYFLHIKCLKSDIWLKFVYLGQSNLSRISLFSYLMLYIYYRGFPSWLQQFFQKCNPLMFFVFVFYFKLTLDE